MDWVCVLFGFGLKGSSSNKLKGSGLVCIEISQGPFCNFSKIEGLK